jgi:hypothetical protein
VRSSGVGSKELRPLLTPVRYATDVVLPPYDLFLLTTMRHMVYLLPFLLSTPLERFSKLCYPENGPTKYRSIDFSSSTSRFTYRQFIANSSSNPFHGRCGSLRRTPYQSNSDAYKAAYFPSCFRRNLLCLASKTASLSLSFRSIQPFPLLCRPFSSCLLSYISVSYYRVR